MFGAFFVRALHRNGAGPTGGMTEKIRTKKTWEKTKPAKN